MTTDIFSEEQRSYVMSRVGSKNTKPELIVRSYLHGLGFRFKIHEKNLPGRPDIVLPKHRCVVFVNGCFWHRHGCKKTSTPKTNLNFWEDKFEKTIKRDKLNYKFLVDNKWEVIVLWECKIHEIAYLKSKLSKVLGIAKK